MTRFVFFIQTHATTFRSKGVNYAWPWHSVTA